MKGPVRKWMLQFLWCSASKPEYRVNEFWDYHAGSTPNTRSFAAESKRDWPDFRPDCDLQMRVRRRMLIDSIYWCNLQSVCAVIQSLRQGLNKVRTANLQHYLYQAHDLVLYMREDLLRFLARSSARQRWSFVLFWNFVLKLCTRNLLLIISPYNLSLCERSHQTDQTTCELQTNSQASSQHWRANNFLTCIDHWQIR